MKRNTEVLNKLRHGLIVSCQALEDEPLHGSEVMAKMAQAAIDGGAVGIRANSTADIKAIKRAVDVPVIGIIKEVYPDSDVYITPTLVEVKQLIDCQVDIIAVDCTSRMRPAGVHLEDFFKQIKQQYPNQLFMADCATVSEAKLAAELGFDIISSTLVGYTAESQGNKVIANDYQIVREMLEIAHDNNKYFIAEGNVNTPEIMSDILELGVDSVVVGSMITRPQLITRKFTSKLTKEVRFIDMDGVLVDENAHIEPRVIEKIQNSNFMPVINTGRLMHDIDFVVDEYNLMSNYKIAANGAHIQSRAGHDIVVHSIADDLRDEIYRALRTPAFANVRVEVNTTNNRYFFDERPADFPKEYKDSSIITNIDNIIKDLTVIGFLVIFDNYEQIQTTVEELAEKYQGQVEFERSSNTSLEIYSSKASKGSAIRYLKTNGYIADDVKTYAYGDSFNDVSMFAEVDESYAIIGHPDVEVQAKHQISNLYEGL